MQDSTLPTLASRLTYTNILSKILLDFLCGILIWWGRRRRTRSRRNNRDVLLKPRDPHLAGGGKNFPRAPVLNIQSNQCMILSWTLSESLISGCLGSLCTWLKHDWDKFTSRGIFEIPQSLASVPGFNKMGWVLSFSHAFYFLFTFNWERTHVLALPVIVLFIFLYLVKSSPLRQDGNSEQKFRTVCSKRSSSEQFQVANLVDRTKSLPVRTSVRRSCNPISATMPDSRHAILSPNLQNRSENKVGTRL